MSIDKRAKTDKVEPNTSLWFGIHKGKTPLDIIRSGNVESIKYLVWLREQKNEKGFPRMMFVADLHHALDQVIRMNQSALSDCMTRFDTVAYSLWVAEKKLKKTKQEEEKTRLANEKKQAQERQAQKIQQNIKEQMEKNRLKNELKAKAQEARVQTYQAAWGEWA